MKKEDKPVYQPKKAAKLQNKEPLEKKEQPVNIAPQQDTFFIQDKLIACRELVQKTFSVFHDLLLNKKLKQNKSDQEKDAERKSLDALIKAAGELDQVNAGEGVMIVGSIGLRELMIMRDRINELDYTLRLTMKELRELKEQLGVKDEKTQ